MKNYAIVEVNSETDKTIHAKLLSDIVSELEAKGYECKKGKGCGCDVYDCSKDGKQLSIVMYVFGFSDNNKETSIQCTNKFPWYKCLFCKISDQEYASGQMLEELVAEVKEIVENDDRYVKIEWMEFDRWRKEFLD